MRGIKRFELRRDDREGGFQVGDELLLEEFVPPGRTIQAADKNTPPFQVGDAGFYTGREVVVRVDYIMPVATVDKLMDLEIPYPAEHAIMSISLVH
jgi:hypothetical protein